jgi:hypothetical protein
MNLTNSGFASNYGGWIKKLQNLPIGRQVGEPVIKMQLGESDDEPMFPDGGPVAKMHRLEEEEDNKPLFGARFAREVYLKAEVAGMSQ